MSRANPGTTARHLQTLWSEGTLGNLTDAKLIERFARRDGERSERAFAALIERHGPVVLRTCRARLRDEHAAHDAFQATFLVLACRAGSLRVQETLGPWLHAVAWRVASSVRSSETVRKRHERIAAERIGRFAEAVCPDDSEPAIHEEIDRLAERYRKPIILCCLAGLTTEHAAQQLGWPVGTVRSRLARGRERLRERLVRRGLAPSVGLAATVALADSAQAATPAALAALTLKMVSQGLASRIATGLVPAAIAAMTRSTLWSMMMIRIRIAGVLLTLGLSTIATAVVLARGGDDPKSAPAPLKPTEATKPSAGSPAAETPQPASSVASKFEAIKAEYDAKNQALYAALEKAPDKRAENELYRTMSPDQLAYCRRMIDLALTAPKDPGARDALLWVIDHPGRSDTHEYGDEFARAAARLVRDHGDDPEAIRIGLRLDNVHTDHRDQLMYGFLASAKSRESKGLARLALGQYLVKKALIARGARKVTGRQSYTLEGVIGDDGKPHDMKVEQTNEEYAYILQAKQCDPDAIRAEAERLFEEVIADYGDIPCITPSTRMQQALLKQAKPEWNGKPLAAEEIEKLMRLIDATPSLAKVAEGHLDEMRNLQVGMPAPEIDGVDFVGKPLKLSDYRGKVVVLAFWGSWCGPCMAEVPRERDLVEKYKGRPFAMLGVDCDEPKATAAKVMEAERMTWPNWHDGEEGNGPIVERYHVRSYPSIFIIDAEGKIRNTHARGKMIDELVEKLVAETEANQAAK